jgi:hypothetical protein
MKDQSKQMMVNQNINKDSKSKDFAKKQKKKLF